MGIIGVVAALTLPNLNSSTGDKEKVVKLKKIYSNLNDAFGRAQAVYGPYSEWQQSQTADRILEFIKVSKDCGNVANQGCFTSTEAKYLNGTNFSPLDYGNPYGPSDYTHRFITADGTSVFVILLGLRRVIVDIDGPNKGANTLGKDIFTFDFDTNTNELIPTGSNYVWSDLYENCFIKGVGCTAWVIENDNMDYLKLTDLPFCPGGGSPLGQDGRTSCK